MTEQLAFLISVFHWGFLGGSTVENPSAMRQTWVQALGREDPLEKEMANCFNFLKSEGVG